MLVTVYQVSCIVLGFIYITVSCPQLSVELAILFSCKYPNHISFPAVYNTPIHIHLLIFRLYNGALFVTT
ncbi:hypothetical protein EB796_007066 [Bugula neritina]|uniref:Uncharacterized protein n=1 Tax=Bugula neritina TaxID=10212 RepID=A0A7J7KAN7_BUGNE|nr:hypothetical protein EB796_007066 [Bugula neritina]